MDDGQVGVGGRRRDDDLLHRAAEVLLCVGAFGEQAGGLDDDFGAHRGPVQLGGVLHLEDAENPAVNGNRVVRVSDLIIVQVAEDGIVLEQVGEGHRVGDVVDGDKLDVAVAQRRAQDVASDAAKPVDADFNWHSSSDGRCDSGSARRGSRTEAESGC